MTGVPIDDERIMRGVSISDARITTRVHVYVDDERAPRRGPLPAGDYLFVLRGETDELRAHVDGPVVLLRDDAEVAWWPSILEWTRSGIPFREAP